MERHTGPGVFTQTTVCSICTIIKGNEGFIKNNRRIILFPNRIGSPTADSGELFVLICQQATQRVGTERQCRTRKRLVPQVITQQPVHVLDTGSHPAPGFGKGIMHGPACQILVVIQEMIIGTPQGGHQEIVTWKAEIRLVGQTVIKHRPVGKALPAEFFVIHILMKIKQYPQTGIGCRLGGTV